jgi:predicted component of type VI protein secretion system
VTLEMDLQNLLMEGSRRLDERSRLSEVFPDLNMSVEAMTNPERVKSSVTMTPDEWKVYFLVDGRRSLSEICRLAGNPDELSTLQILHHLVKAKFVAVVNPPEDETPVPSAEAGGISTSKFQDGKAVTPASSASGVSVQFQDGGTRPPRPDADDTKEIVSPKAGPYMSNRKQVVSSRLVLVTSEGETSFPLTRDAYTIGRHRNNDIVISDPKVSSFPRPHRPLAEGYVIVDLKSRNGSYINGKRIETGLLKTGDEVRMGTARLAYKVDYTGPVSSVS